MQSVAEGVYLRDVNLYGPRIAKARKLADLTQVELAEQLEVDVQTVKRKESPKGKAPKKHERIAIAHICNVSLDFIEGRAPDVETETDAQERRLRELERQTAELLEAVVPRPEVEAEFRSVRDALGELVVADEQRRREIEALATGGRRQESGGGRDRG